VSDTDLSRQRQVVEAFLAASRGGDFAALLELLDPNVAFHADQVAARLGGHAELRGAEVVARTFRGRARGALPALVNGEIALVVAPQGRLRIVLRLTVADDRISAIEALADPARLAGLDVALLDGG
jgi:RNA polymerase sigma-70 factor (ECF subfamily)